MLFYFLFHQFFFSKIEGNEYKEIFFPTPTIISLPHHNSKYSNYTLIFFYPNKKVAIASCAACAPSPMFQPSTQIHPSSSSLPSPYQIKTTLTSTFIFNKPFFLKKRQRFIRNKVQEVPGDTYKKFQTKGNKTKLTAKQIQHKQQLRPRHSKQNKNRAPGSTETDFGFAAPLIKVCR
jgi:hypothetical protein